MVGIGLHCAGGALDHRDCRFAALVVGLTTNPQALPGRIVDFSAETGCFAVLIKRDAFDGDRIGRQGQETVQSRPQTFAFDWQAAAIEFSELFARNAGNQAGGINDGSGSGGTAGSDEAGLEEIKDRMRERVKENLSKRNGHNARLNALQGNVP